MFNLIRKVKNWFIPKHDEPYGWSPEEFIKARRWAKNQHHPKFPGHPKLSLWDYVNSNWIDSEYKLNEINKVKTKKKKAI